MIRIFVLYAMSGFVSLGYQVAWFRIFTDWFGSTNQTFALVVCNFIGGLGLGALLSARIADSLASGLRLRDPLRVYGVTELCVGGTALLTVLAPHLSAPDWWGPFPYVLDNGIRVQTISYRLAQVGLAAACVFIPCLFMGVTFPLLCKTFRGIPVGGRVPAAFLRVEHTRRLQRGVGVSVPDASEAGPWADALDDGGPEPAARRLFPGHRRCPPRCVETERTCGAQTEARGGGRHSRCAVAVRSLERSAVGSAGGRPVQTHQFPDRAEPGSDDVVHLVLGDSGDFPGQCARAPAGGAAARAHQNGVLAGAGLLRPHLDLRRRHHGAHRDLVCVSTSRSFAGNKWYDLPCKPPSTVPDHGDLRVRPVLSDLPAVALRLQPAPGRWPASRSCIRFEHARVLCRADRLHPRRPAREHLLFAEIVHGGVRLRDVAAGPRVRARAPAGMAARARGGLGRRRFACSPRADSTAAISVPAACRRPAPYAPSKATEPIRRSSPRPAATGSHSASISAVFRCPAPTQNRRPTCASWPTFPCSHIRSPKRCC